MKRVQRDDMLAALNTAFTPCTIELNDDSARHAGHAGAQDGGHYTLRITAERFCGLSRLARHRLVYDSLSTLMPQGIHALAIQARAPDEL